MPTYDSRVALNPSRTYGTLPPGAVSAGSKESAMALSQGLDTKGAIRALAPDSMTLDVDGHAVTVAFDGKVDWKDLSVGDHVTVVASGFANGKDDKVSGGTIEVTPVGK